MAPERKQDRHWGCGTDGRIMGRGKNTMTVCSIKTVQRHVFIRRHNNNKLTSLGVSGNYGTKATLYRNFKLFVLILTCSVSAKFATCPKSLTPRTLNRVPARSQLSRDIRRLPLGYVDGTYLNASTHHLQQPLITVHVVPLQMQVKCSIPAFYRNSLNSLQHFITFIRYNTIAHHI